MAGTSFFFIHLLVDFLFFSFFFFFSLLFLPVYSLWVFWSGNERANCVCVVA